MKQYDKRNSHVSSKLHSIQIALIIIDTLLLRPSLRFNILHPFILH